MNVSACFHLRAIARTISFMLNQYVSCYCHGVRITPRKHRRLSYEHKECCRLFLDVGVGACGRVGKLVTGEIDLDAISL